MKVKCEKRMLEMIFFQERNEDEISIEDENCFDNFASVRNV